MMSKQALKMISKDKRQEVKPEANDFKHYYNSSEWLI